MHKHARSIVPASSTTAQNEFPLSLFNERASAAPDNFSENNHLPDEFISEASPVAPVPVSPLSYWEVMRLRGIMQHFHELVERLHTLKTEHQYLGRYSVPKLCAFYQYQSSVSIFRVLAVVILSPTPTLIVLAGLDCIKLRDPRLSAAEQYDTFLRSVFSHFIMTYMFLLAGKQALGLSDNNSNYTHYRCLLIAICVSICQEALWVTTAFAWKFPVPMREFVGVTPWSMFVVAFNFLFAKNDLLGVLHKLKRYLPVVGTQLTLFYFLLGLSIVFAMLPYEAQLLMIFTFPIIKLAIKRQLWKFSRELDDISADVTICMVEISSSLYQTVCMQYVKNNMMAILIMAMDFLQAVVESKTYINHEYVGDNQSTLLTAYRIASSGIVAGKQSHRSGRETSTHATEHPPLTIDTPPSFQTWSAGDSSNGDTWSISSTLYVLLAKLESAWGRFRRRQRSKRQTAYAVRAIPAEKTTRKPPAVERMNSGMRKPTLSRMRSSLRTTLSPTTARTMGEFTARTSRGATTVRATGAPSACASGASTAMTSRSPVTARASIYVQASHIRKNGAKRLLDFEKIDAKASNADQSLTTRQRDVQRQIVQQLTLIQREHEEKRLGMEQKESADQEQIVQHHLATTALPKAQLDDAQSDKMLTQARRGNRFATVNSLQRRKSNMITPVTSKAQPYHRARSNSLDNLWQPSEYGHGGSVKFDEPLPPLVRKKAVPMREDVKREIRQHLLEAAEHDSAQNVLRLSAGGLKGIKIDNVFILRKDQARILEQTLQLLFAAEVLLFVEYMEVFMPLLYASCIGTLWRLPNAKYNVILNSLTETQVIVEVATSVGYAALELMSFLSVYWFVKKRYGISALYQLAFLLETYWMTLQGKLIGCFITILNSSTIHQGVDLSFRFDVNAQMQGVQFNGT